MPTTAQLENIYYYARKSQNDATTNQIILKTLTCEE